MRRLAIACIAAFASMNASAQIAPDQARATAVRVLDHLDRGEFAQVEAMFDATMKQAVPAATLEQVWKSLPAAGTRGEPKLQASGDTQVVRIPLARGEGKFDATIAVDAQGRVSGLLVRPAEASIAPPPAVPADANYTESETQVGTGEHALGATLSMPKGPGPFPAVVLVHGSGAHDRDETIGPNRPFLDIARGLAAQGIAVLRYEKRSKARPQDYSADSLDIDTETTDDAVAALVTLRATPGIDARRVFVLGHSQGGMMAPRIAIKDGHVAGLVLLAAPARNLLDILVEQNERLLKMQGADTSEAGIAHMAKLKAQIAAVRGTGDVATIGTPLNQPAHYWRSVDAVDPVAEARKADEPMLVLQGARDIQVVDADWQAWQAAFGGDKRVTFKHYPTLNHLAMESAEGAGLDSYAKPGHVDATLIGDIAQWIKARR